MEKVEEGKGREVGGTWEECLCVWMVGVSVWVECVCDGMVDVYSLGSGAWMEVLHVLVGKPWCYAAAAAAAVAAAASCPG